MPSMTMMSTMDVTTAEVAASPTAAALRPDCMPRRQPTSATRTPNTALLLTPMKKLGQAHGAAGLLEVLGGAEPQHAHPDDGAAQDPDEVRVDREQRHHQDQGQHPGQDEELHRRDPHGGERVDLLVGVHRPELRGEGGAGPARHDDGRHDAADLARHRDGHQVRDEDRGAELLELDGPDEREDEPDQEADEADDAERARPAVLDDDEEIADPEPRPAAEQRAEREHALPEKGESRHGLDPARGRPGADPRQPGGRARARPVCLSGTASARRSRRWTPSGSPARSLSMPRALASSSTLMAKVTRPESQSVTRLVSKVSRWTGGPAWISRHTSLESGNRSSFRHAPASSTRATSGIGRST